MMLRIEQNMSLYLKYLKEELIIKRYYCLIQMEKLPIILSEILSSIKETSDFAGQTQMMVQLSNLSIRDSNLNAFEAYIHRQFAIPSKVIYQLLNSLSLHVQCRNIIGRKLLILWIKYKFFEALNLFKRAEELKRNKITQFLETFNFDKLLLKDFIIGCCEVAGQELLQSDIPQYQSMIMEGRDPADFKIIFSPLPPVAVSQILPQITQASYNPDKSIKEAFGDMVVDYQYFPKDSLEFKVQKELLVSYIKKYEDELYDTVSQIIPELKQATNSIVNLQDDFRKEFGVLPGEVAKIFKKISSEDSKKQLYENLCALKSKIMAINVLELQRLISKTNDAKALIKNKEVIFVLGTTGSGKSTNILGFLGYTLRQATYKKLKTLIPVENLTKQHATFYTSPQAKSCTRYINSVPIPDQMYKKGTRSSKKNLVICDSPGFGDNAGVEVDIANGVGMINALYGAASVRVVVLLAYEALISNRMKGAIEIGEIISNLFYDLSEVLESLVFLFNKVPKNQIEAIPQLIRNKIQNLTQIEKSNQKLKIFLDTLYEHSKQQSNYIYPLQSNYRTLFHEISSKTPITSIKQNFLYEFTASTKKQITNFIHFQKSKIKDLFSNNLYGQARFHLDILQKMKAILYVDDKVQEAYAQICKFIEQRSRYFFTQFENVLVDIENGVENSKIKNELKESRQKVIQISKYFNHFQGLSIISQQQTEKLIEQYKQKLKEKANDQNNLNKRYKRAVQIFSQELSSQLKKKVIQMIGSSLYKQVRQLRYLYDEANYQKMQEGIRKCKIYYDFISSISPKHQSLQQFRQFKSLIKNYAISYLQFLKETTDQNKSNMTQRIVNQSKQKLTKLEFINSYNIIGQDFNLKQSLLDYNKAIVKKCRKYIREIQNIDFSIEFEEASNKKSTDEKILASKKKQIELIMGISNIKQILEKDFMYAKENIARKLKQNVEILNQCISGLRSGKSEQIDRNINQIKKACDIVIKCSQLVDNADNSRQIAQSITKEFMRYISKQKQIIKNIDIRLNMISSQTLRKLEQQYKNNQNYSKMASIDPEIEKAVNEIKAQFNKILRNPFVYFNEKELNYLQQKKHYRSITYFLEKFDKLCYFAIEVEELLNKDEYSLIAEVQAQVFKKLSPFLLRMREEFENFNNLQNIQQEPHYIKDLLKTMLAMSQKQYICKYLGKHMQFQLVQSVNLVKKQLENIKDIIQQKFKATQSQPDKIQLIINLLKICKFYSSIEDIFKSDKIGFKELQKRISASYNDNLKNDQERAKFLIESSKPSKMHWQQIKKIYDQFISLDNNEGKRKRDIILKEMFKIEAFVLNELRKYNNQINQNAEIFLNNRDQMNNFLDTFKEALELQKNLNQLYCQADKKRININKRHLREVGSNITQVFSTEFDRIRKLLTDYNIINIKKKINSFGNLQSIIQNVFINQMQEQPEESRQMSQKILKFINEKRKFLLEQISAFQEKHPSYQNQFGNNGNNKKLKDLFLKYYSLIEEQIKEKYQNSADKLEIDNKFIRYYQHLKNASDPYIIDIKSHIIKNIEIYFNELFQNYKQKSQQSAEQSDKIAKRIKQSIDNLPIDLKIVHSKQFQKLIGQIKLQNDDLVDKLSSKISTNPGEIDNYFQQAHKAKSHGQMALHKKLVDKLDEVLQSKSKILSKISEKDNFIKDYFVKAYDRNKRYLEEDPDMSKRMKSRLRNELEKLKRALQFQVAAIKKQFENFNKSEFNEQLRIQSIKQIFRIFSIISQLSEEHQQFKTQVFSQFIAALSEIANLFNQKAMSKPTQNLLSINAFDSGLVIKLQNYLQYIIMNGATITTLRNQIINSSYSRYLNDVVKKYQNMQPYNYINYFKQQLLSMIQEADLNELCDDKKRNMNNKQLQAYFVGLDKTFQILLDNENLFNQYILLNKGKYSAKSMYDRFERLFDILINQAINEVEDTFKDYNIQPAVKINLTIDILRIMKQKKLKFIKKEKVNQKLSELEKLVKNKFQSIKAACLQKMEAARQIFTNVQNEIKVEQKKKDNQIIQVKLTTRQKIQTKTQEISDKYTQKIKNQAQQNKKKDLQKAKKTDIASYVNQYNSECNSLIVQIEKKFQSLVQKLKNSVEKPVKQLTDYLILFKKAVLDVKHENQKNSTNLEIIMNQIPKFGPKFIKIVETSLSQNSNDLQSIGKVILTTNKVFSNYVTNMINRLVKGKDIDYVLQNLKKINISGRQQLKPVFKNTIKSCYQQFKRKYQEFKNIYKNSPSQSSIIQISIECRDLGKQLKHDFYQSKNPIKGNKVQLLAGIFALWAILKSEKFEQEVQWTMEPHPTQITALLLLLGIVHQKQIIDHRLAQVGTGEGKSVVLAGLSSYLALCGFRVRCACYSAYLSGRDQASFRPLFERLGVENEIKYGTFNQLCQDILNSDGNNFKDEVSKLLLEKPKSLLEKAANFFGKSLIKVNRGPNQISASPTILVIDEVDVFFQDSFFGNSYCPAIKLKDPTVSNFLQYIFNEVTKLGDNVDVSVLIKSKQFEKLLQKYPSIKDLLINQVHGMVSGALSYKHDYFLIDKKLVYKDNDTIASNISYGYKTVFANIYQHQRNNVSRDNLQEALQIGLMIAEFSYAMLPKYFQNILGVTGTLQVLPQYKKRQLVQRYKINDQYAIPSAFGVNNRRIDNYLIVPDAYIHKEIVERIKLIADRRPIIIFFSSSRELNEFFLSSAFQPFQKRTSNLTEQHQASVRDARIIRAVNHNVITLMTNSFGRGTDFVLLDQDIKDKGGLHVIHCFLSLDESEQVQIKGRTARQSNKGSYDAVISQNWLEQLNLKGDSIPKNAPPDVVHSIFVKARQERIDNLAKSTLKLLEEADKKHQQVVKIYSKQQLAQTDLINYVSILNKYPQIRKTNIRTVLGIDATGSMSSALKKTCEICSVSFERVYKVLQKDNVKASIEIKIMIYRNYNSPYQEILQSTAYENTPFNLKKFLERATAKGGWYYEQAMEVMFQAANKDDQLDQVIVIGDAPANTLDGIGKARKIYGQNYWNTNGFPYTNVDIEVNKFKAKKIPVHGFYLAAAGPAFTKITQATGGKVAPFNLSSPKVSDELTSFIVEQILYLIEVKEGKPGLKLVQSYRKMFT